MNGVRSELVSIGLAVQFLTRLPVPVGNAYTDARFAASVKHYPLVGALIGSIAAAIYAIASLVFPAAVSVILCTALTVLLTGAFHEDGLADMFDGIGGGSTRERALEIMKDSRIGTFGTAALVFALALKVAVLVNLGTAIVIALVAGHTASRLSAVAVIASSRYVRFEGKAKPVARSIGVAGIAWASAITLAILYGVAETAGYKPAVGSIVGLAAGHVAARAFYERKLGGYTGDCLGAVQQISELGFYLGVLACL